MATVHQPRTARQASSQEPKKKQKPTSALFLWRNAFLSSKLKATTRYVLLEISTHMDRDGNDAFPGIKTLVERTALSKRAVIEHIHTAAAKGWIKVSVRGAKNGQAWRSHRYEISYPEGWAPAAQPSPEGGYRPSP